MFPTLTARYNAMPRSMRWGLLFVAALAGYFLIVEPAVNWSLDQRAQADKLERSLEARKRLSDSAGSADRSIERSIVAHGAPKAPRANLPDPAGFVSQKAADLAQKHDVLVKRRTRRAPSLVQGVEWNGAKVERASVELVVECDTERFMALLKDLESSPDITQVSSVRMNKVSEPGVSLGESTLMQITLTPEVWIIAGSASSAATAEPVPPASPDPAITPEELEKPATPAPTPVPESAPPATPATPTSTPSAGATP